jgi:glycolate oxidase FAD binding subunit
MKEAARTTVESACAGVTEAATDDAVDGVSLSLVARPGSTQEVAEVLRACAEHDLAVVPRGRGTKLTWGLPPERADVILDLSGMDQVLDHAAGDLIVEVQAGARLADLQQVVAGEGQRLAVDETVAGASVGGTVAAGASGPSRLAYGTMRDLLIGVTVVRADGVVAKAGGRVVKNVAGYDLGKLVHGSFGTLAVITDAVFRLHPLPAARRYVTVPVDNPDHAHRVVHALVHSQTVPGAVELDLPEHARGSVTALLEGTPDGVLSRTDTVLGLLGHSADTAEEAPTGWGAYPWDTSARGDDRGTALKLTFALTGLGSVLEAVRSCGAPVHVRGSGGAGVVYAVVPAGTEPATVKETVERLRSTCLAHGGSTVVLDAPVAVKHALDPWGPVPGLELMRRVKDQFDPDRRLSPGRFVGGI